MSHARSAASTLGAALDDPRVAAQRWLLAMRSAKPWNCFLFGALAWVALCACGRPSAIADGGVVDSSVRPDAARWDAGPGNFAGELAFDDAALSATDPTLLYAGPSPCRQPVLARVTHVTDGDTITVQHIETAFTERVRIIGVDTPEIAHASGEVDQCFGREATVFTEALRGRLVWLTFDGLCTDVYERTLAYVHYSSAPEGNWSRQLLRRGFARTLLLGRNRSLEGVLRNDEGQAQAMELGLWSACP